MQNFVETELYVFDKIR